MNRKKTIARIAAGFLSVVTFLSAVIGPVPAMAADSDAGSGYMEDYPDLKDIRDMLDEDESAVSGISSLMMRSLKQKTLLLMQTRILRSGKTSKGSIILQKRLRSPFTMMTAFLLQKKEAISLSTMQIPKAGITDTASAAGSLW